MRQSLLTFGYRLTGMSTRSLSLMLLLLKRSKYDSVSFLVSPFWILSISGKRKRCCFRRKKKKKRCSCKSTRVKVTQEIYSQERWKVLHIYRYFLYVYLLFFTAFNSNFILKQVPPNASLINFSAQFPQIITDILNSIDTQITKSMSNERQTMVPPDELKCAQDVMGFI